MIVPVISASMNIPDVGATVSPKTGTNAPSGVTFDAVLTSLAQPPDSNVPTNGDVPVLQDVNGPAAAIAPEAAAAASLLPGQPPWMAQIDAKPMLSQTPAGDHNTKPAALRSRKSVSEDGAQAGLPQPDPASKLSAALTAAMPEWPAIPGLPLPENAKAPDSGSTSAAATTTMPELPAIPGLPLPEKAKAPDSGSTAGPNVAPDGPLSPVGTASDSMAASAGKMLPSAQPNLEARVNRPEESKRSDASEKGSLAAAAPEQAQTQIKSAAPEISQDPNAGFVPSGAPNIPVTTSHNDHGDAASGRDVHADISSNITLAKLMQLATSGPAAPDPRPAATTSPPERNGSQQTAADKSPDQANSGPSARAGQPADFAAGLARTHNASGHPDNVSPFPDDSSPNAAMPPHAASTQPSVAPTALQGNPASPNLLNLTALNLGGAQMPNSVHGAPNDAGVPVKLAFPAAANTSDAPSGLDALALRIANYSANGDKNFSIRLDPPELGRIEVNLHVNTQGHAAAEVSADKPQTLELLQRDAPSLERALKDAGLNLAGGLAFSLKGDGKSGAWRDSQSSARGRTLRIASIDAASASVAIAGSAGLAAQAYWLPTARLDIRV